MKNIIFIFASILLLIGCDDSNQSSNEKLPTDRKSLIEKDRRKLQESSNSYKELFYRFAKIGLRSSIMKKNESPELTALTSKLSTVSNKLTKFNSNEITPTDLLTIYQDYRTMKESLKSLDEDMFPTLSDVFKVSRNKALRKDFTYLSGDKKFITQNGEHALLSIFALFTKDLGDGIAQYEAAKTDPLLFPEGEKRALLQFFRGFLFNRKGLYYLSEKELSQNIEWLNNNTSTNLNLTKKLLGWNKFTDEQTRLWFHSMNHIFRGFDRIKMDTEEDKKIGLEDFEDFLKNAEKLNLNNELIWSVECYVYINQEENEKSIASLTKLKSSSYLGQKERKMIDLAIKYLEKKESGQLPNSVFDKAFLGDIVTKYFSNQFAQIDWKKMMESQNIPYSKELFETYNSFNGVFKSLKDYSDLNLESVKELGSNAGEKLEKEGKELFEKAKGFLNK